jgi:hypothetical protein
MKHLFSLRKPGPNALQPSPSAKNGFPVSASCTKGNGCDGFVCRSTEIASRGGPIKGICAFV